MSLSRIQRLRLAAVQEDCRDQLDILGHTLTLRISKERGPAAAQVLFMFTVQRNICQTAVCWWWSACFHARLFSLSWTNTLNKMVCYCAFVWVCVQEKTRLTKLRRDWWVIQTKEYYVASTSVSDCLISRFLCSQYTSQQVSKLHLELEEDQSFSFLQQAAEEEEQTEKAENIRRFITA